jgi:DNA-directed RNA polymerase specialized sigma24 family protein
MDKRPSVAVLDQNEWLAELRERFLQLARRRVAAGAVEEIVQEALRVVSEEGLKPGQLAGDKPALAWAYQVLRNAVGNHYSRQQRRGSRPPNPGGPGPVSGTPLEALERGQLTRLLDESLRELRRSSFDGARYLLALRKGRTPAELAAIEGLTPALLHRRVYLYRMQLREILVARGIAP